MSLVKDAAKSVDLRIIPGRLATYRELIDAAECCFELHGKKLGEIIRDHAHNLMSYDIILRECNLIENTIKLKVEEIEGQLYKKYNENHQRALSTSDIKMYIKGDPDYVSGVEILIEVIHIKQQLEAIVDALKSMGWSLTNITKLRIAQLEDVEL